MGEVYKGRDTRLDREVAIKILPSALAADPEFRERFNREARTISKLTHPNICTVHDVGEQGGTAFLVMELLEGETLEARCARAAAKGSGLPLEEALRIVIQMADALVVAHRQGIVHRDRLLTLTGEPTASVFLSTPFNEAQARFSPNGRWTAYASDESGRFEVYVRPFPAGSAQR
jgi:hypothetical protein